MNKTEVADALNCSTRQVEKYASGGRLGEIKYIRGKRGREAKYDDKAVTLLRDELERNREQEIGQPPTITMRGTSTPEGFAANDERFLMLARVLADEMAKRFPPMLPPAPNGDAPAPAAAVVPVADKVMLTLADAAALTSLSKDHLSGAIHTGKLKAKKIGRGWKIKRDDLDLYVKKL
jgi:excisionase family DNA binding protein